MITTRRLAAILAADVVGYSRLMGADEKGTHERLKTHLRELVNPKVKEHRGRIVKNTGDGFLAEFSSVVAAVRCAVEIQRAMADRNADTTEDKRITFRMGIDLSDVIAEPDDIYGDGVNVAARLEALADPGGICVSRVVRDQIRDKLPYPFEDKGEQTVKNIARSVRVYALRPEAVAELPAAGVSLEARQRRRGTPLALALAVAATLVIAVTRDHLRIRFLGAVSSSRRIVFASSPVLSDRRLAARPVGAHNAMARVFARRILRIELTTVVLLPTPGPPVITNTFEASATRTASI